MIRNPFKQIENKIAQDGNSSGGYEKYHENENFRLKQEVLMLSEENQCVNNELNRLKLIISNMDREKDELLNTIDEKTVENVKLKKENITNNQVIDNLNEQLTQMNTLVNKVTHHIEALTNELNTLRINYEYLNAENEELKKNCDSSVRDSRNLQEDLITITRENQVIHIELEKSNCDKTRLKEQIQEYIQEMTKFRDIINNRDNQLAEMSNNYTQLNNELNEMKNNLTTSESEKFNLKMELQIKKLDIKRLKEKIEYIEKELAKKISECKDYELKQSVSARNFQRCEDELKKSKSEIKDLMKDLVHFRELNCRLEQAKDDMTRQITRKDLDVQHLKNRLDDKIAENDLLKSQLNSEKNMVKYLEELVASTRQKDYQTQISSQKNSSEMKLLKDRIVLSEQKIQVLNKEIARLKTKLSESEAENDILKRQLYNDKFDTVLKVPFNSKTNSNESSLN
ncbi:unnamed protein product [Brachionus calyciflorus]|uniref:Uncharacterized protein n=1 Tax=Brachionus calyciflorus TaxID=104777 RepID=A0A814MNI9_9BILA|nr:unnamed protein product [Brachionus calyciflorus]